MLDQFMNLLDPSTTLGAYIISLLASATFSFVCGRKYERHSRKKNIIKAEEVDGTIYQNERNTNENKIFNEELNLIQAKTVKGDIQQDCTKK